MAKEPFAPAETLAQRPVGFDLFSYDWDSGIATWRKFDYNAVAPDQSRRQIVRTQDVESILDDNKGEQYNAKGTFCQRDRLGVKAATIPMIVQQKWLIEDGIDLTIMGECEWTAKRVKMKLNSNEYAYLRVAEFQL